jgi:hypothetical protein
MAFSNSFQFFDAFLHRKRKKKNLTLIGRARALSLTFVVDMPLLFISFIPKLADITKIIAEETSQYAVCIPTGANKVKDTNNGFFMTMNTNVDVFAAKIRADPKQVGGIVQSVLNFVILSAVINTIWQCEETVLFLFFCLNSFG